MSCGGRRPPLPQEVERYAPWQRRRLRMRPGLTCLWTLEGRNRLSFDRLVQFDLAPTDNLTVSRDLGKSGEENLHARACRGPRLSHPFPVAVAPLGVSKRL